MKSNRVAFGQAVYDLAAANPKVVVVDSDLTKQVNFDPFVRDYADRYFECGIAEQNVFGVAAGLASCHLIPFAASFAVFSTMRALDQVRNMICYNKLDVKVIGTHAGVETGQDGGTHQAIEDLAITRALPHMRVLVPATPLASYRLTAMMAATPGPFYMRFGREPSAEIYDETDTFPLGGSKTVREGNDVTFLACGRMVELSLQAAEILATQGIDARVIDMYSIKPLDIEAVRKAAVETEIILTVEDHSIIGGLGGAVCEVVAEEGHGKVARIGLPDEFGRSGEWKDLYRYFHLTAEDIANQALTRCSKKR